MTTDSVMKPHRLSPRAKRTFIALTEVSIPAGEHLNAPIDEDEITEKVGLALTSMGTDGRRATLLIVFLFNWLAFFRYGRAFSDLPRGRQTAWVHSWVDSGFVLFRMAVRALLTLIKPIHLANRRVGAQLAYSSANLVVEPIENPVTLPPEQVVTQLTSDTEVRVQVVVIGSGAGGAVVAAELAERGIDVAIVEAGRHFSPSELGRDPLWSLRETYLQGGATVALGRPAIPIPLGQTVGGTTTVNSGTCFRTPDRVLDKWDALGVGVDRGALDAAFARVEERINVRPVPPELLGGSSHVIARGAEALGLKHGPLKRNIGDCRMSGVCAFGCPRGAKQSMNVTYVPRALEHGATLYTGFRAERVLNKDGRAAGVIARPRDGGPSLTINADIVISACGSIGGVPFLARNGVGSKHLGRHLSIHPCGKIAAIMPDAVNGWRDTPQGYGIYELFDQGIMFEGAFVPPELGSIAIPFVGRRFTEVMEQYRNLAMFGLLVADEPNGRVYSGPGGRPIISYWMSKPDLERMREGLVMLTKVFFAAGAESVLLPIAGKEEQPSLEAALSVLNNPLDPWLLEVVAFHPLGTARMSARAQDGVVNPELAVWDRPGLYVIDGSIFPSSLGVNPQLSIMAHATMAAERIASQLG
jgi:choline dehydrogenase-like flavoprotein